MDIVSKRQHFDCPENTEDEENYILSVYKKRVSTPMEEDDILASLGLPSITVTDFSKLPPPPPPPKKKKSTPTPPPFIEQPCHIVDNYTQFVRHTLALKIYGNNIPLEPPKATDPPELVADLMTLHYATIGSKAFKETELYPLVTTLFEYIQSRIPPTNTALRKFHADLLKTSDFRSEESNARTNPSAWTLKPCGDHEMLMKVTLSGGRHAIFVSNSEASLLEVLHNIYHFQEYICAAIATALDGVEYGALPYVELWRLLVDTHFNSPIFEWQDFSFKPFVELMLDLFRVWVYVKSDVIPK